MCYTEDGQPTFIAAVEIRVLVCIAGLEQRLAVWEAVLVQHPVVHFLYHRLDRRCSPLAPVDDEDIRPRRRNVAQSSGCENIDVIYLRMESLLICNIRIRDFQRAPSELSIQSHILEELKSHVLNHGGELYAPVQGGQGLRGYLDFTGQGEAVGGQKLDLIVLLFG